MRPKLVILVFFFVFSLCCQRTDQNTFLSQDKVSWLKQEAARQLQGCQRTGHDGTILYTPDGEGNYAALWTRDFYYMVGNAFELMPQDHIKKAILYLLNGQREDGCIPDRVQEDGLAVYSAGPVNNPLGDPPTDNSQFFVLLVSTYVNKTGDMTFFKENVASLVAAMDYTPRSSAGLVFIDPLNPHSPYGFTDTIAKTGELLFSSLLYWHACTELVDLFDKIDEKDLAHNFQNRAQLIEKNLDKLWEPEKNMYLAATQQCRQVDIWGNAYAIYIHFPLGDKKAHIVDYLAQNYDKIVMRGQVRHLIEPDFWQKTLIPIKPGTYQNGAYWGTASGWLAYAFSEAFPELSTRILNDLLNDYQQYGAHECINTDYAQLNNYVASVTNPLGALEKM